MAENLFYENVKYEDRGKIFLYSLTSVNMIMHLHNEMEILFITEGDMFLLINNKNIHLKKGDIAVINPFEPHGTILGNEKCIHLVLQFNPFEIFNGIDHLKNKICTDYHIDESYGSVYLKLRDTLLELYKQCSIPEYKVLATNSYLGVLYTHILRNLSWKDVYASGTLCRIDDTERFRKVIEYIAKHLNEKITLDKIAKVANFSIYHFSRFFKRMSGKTFVDYLNTLRINKAESILLTSSKQIGEISSECGFSSIKTFNRIFLQMHGVSPRVFRQKNDRERFSTASHVVF